MKKYGGIVYLFLYSAPLWATFLFEKNVVPSPSIGEERNTKKYGGGAVMIVASILGFTVVGLAIVVGIGWLLGP